jgi:hypothetical protein
MSASVVGLATGCGTNEGTLKWCIAWSREIPEHERRAPADGPIEAHYNLAVLLKLRRFVAAAQVAVDRPIGRAATGNTEHSALHDHAKRTVLGACARSHRRRKLGQVAASCQELLKRADAHPNTDLAGRHFSI